MKRNFTFWLSATISCIFSLGVFGCVMDKMDNPSSAFGDGSPQPRGTAAFFGNKQRMDLDGNGFTYSNMVIGPGSVATNIEIKDAEIEGYVKTNHTGGVRISNTEGDSLVVEGNPTEFVGVQFFNDGEFKGRIGASDHSDMDFHHLNFGSINAGANDYAEFWVGLGGEHGGATPQPYVDGMVSNLEYRLSQNVTSEFFHVRGLSLILDDDLGSSDNWSFVSPWMWTSGHIQMGPGAGEAMFFDGIHFDNQYIVTFEAYIPKMTTVNFDVYYIGGWGGSPVLLGSFDNPRGGTRIRTNRVSLSTNWSYIIISNRSSTAYAQLDNFKIYSAPIESGILFHSDIEPSLVAGHLTYDYEKKMIKIGSDMDFENYGVTNASSIATPISSGHKLYADTTHSSISGLTDLHFYRSMETYKGSPVYYGTQGGYFLWTYDAYMYGYQWMVTTNRPGTATPGPGVNYWMVDEPSGPINAAYTNYSTHEYITVSYESLEALGEISDLHCDVIKAGNSITNHLVEAPTTATSAGDVGMMAWTNGYFYVCVSNSVWRRVQMDAW